MTTWILQRLKGDKMIWLIVFLLALFSLPVVYTGASHPMYAAHGSPEYHLLKHAVLLAAGFVIMFLIHRFDYRIFARISYPLLVIAIPVLIYTLVFGREVNGAARWISVLGFSFQPSDFAKVALLVYLAKMLTEKQNVFDDFQQGFLPIIGWVLASTMLIGPANLSTAMLLFMTCLVLMYIAGVNLKYLGSFIAIGLLAGVILFSISDRAQTWRNRISDWWVQLTEPEVMPQYQMAQACLAVYNGGFVGVGSGHSTQANYVPESTSDMIFPIIVEEYGSLIGGFIILVLYILLMVRCVGIVTLSKTFGALLAAGLSFMLVLQALVNMAVSVGLLPTTGLPLPLMSMGGTSILFTCISLGIILSVSRHALDERAAEKNTPELTPA